MLSAWTPLVHSAQDAQHGRRALLEGSRCCSPPGVGAHRPPAVQAAHVHVPHASPAQHPTCQRAAPLLAPRACSRSPAAADTTEPNQSAYEEDVGPHVLHCFGETFACEVRGTICIGGRCRHPGVPGIRDTPDQRVGAWHVRRMCMVEPAATR
jgi:hypothetical protein